MDTYRLGLKRRNREQIIDAIINIEISIRYLESEIKNKKEKGPSYNKILASIQMVSAEKELLKQVLEMDKTVHMLFGFKVVDNKR